MYPRLQLEITYNTELKKEEKGTCSLHNSSYKATTWMYDNQASCPLTSNTSYRYQTEDLKCKKKIFFFLKRGQEKAPPFSLTPSWVINVYPSHLQVVSWPSPRQVRSGQFRNLMRDFRKWRQRPTYTNATDYVMDPWMRTWSYARET